MTKKIQNTFVILSFFLAIATPLLFSNKVGGEISINENRYLARFPIIFKNGMNLSPTLRSDLNNWISDNAGFRSDIQSLMANVDYKIFHVSPTSKVMVGRDGWFYYTGDNNLAIATGEYPLTDELLQAMAYNQTKIQVALNKRGIDYAIVLVPSKVSIYPEYIAGGKFKVGRTVIDIVTDYLRSHTTIPVINTKEDLLLEKAKQQIYFKTDTHWNEVGAYTGYRSVITQLNKMGIIHSNPIEVSFFPSTCRGEFSGMMGDANLLQPEPYSATKINTTNAVNVRDGEYYDKMVELTKQDDTVLGYDNFQNPRGEIIRTLIYGDSFFVLEKVPNLFAEIFANLDLIRSDSIRNIIIKQSKPDLVILERTERYIFTLAYPADPELNDTPSVTQK